MNVLLIPLGLGLLLFSAFIAGAETAFFHLSRRDKEALRKDGRPTSARVLQLLSKPRQLLLTFLICNEGANLCLAAVVAVGVVQTWGEAQVWWTPIIVVPVLLLLSETVPKSLAVRYPVMYARRAGAIIGPVYEALLPARWALMEVGKRLLSPAGTPPWSLPSQIEEEELKHLVDLGEQAGTIGKDERDMIHSVFAFDDTNVAKLMTPRTEMIAFPVDTPLAELLEGVRDQRYARVPIYEDNPDNVIGILYTKDLLSLRLVQKVGPRRSTQRTLKELLRKAYFLPLTMKADEVFREFQSRGVHMAIVVDEYGGVAGLVTMDDVLGELFGEMLDEIDTEPEAAVKPLGAGEWEVQGHVEVPDFNSAVGASLTLDDDYTTVGGYVLDHLGRLPDAGEAVEADGWRFEVVEVFDSRVTTLRACRTSEPEGEEATA